MMSLLHKTIHGLLIILCGFVAMACEVKVPDSENTLTIGIHAEPDTLNFITSTDAYSSMIKNLIHDTLIDQDLDTFEYKPHLAKNWKISPDRLEYTFYLRDDVTWHDGHKFTADDVIYSFQQIQNPRVKAPHLRVYYEGAGIKKIEKIDDYTVKFISERKYYKALSICGGIDIVPKHLYDVEVDFDENPANRHPIGLGPYRFLEWKTGKRIVLQKNENYWGEKPGIKKIKYMIVTDEAVALQVLKKGDIDYSGLRPIQWVKQTDSDKFNAKFNKFKYVSPGYNYIGWNLKTPYFQDQRVRLAMTSLINREKMLEKIQYGLGQVVTGPLFVESPQYDSTIKPYPYDPLKAKQLLDEAGWIDRHGDGVREKDGRDFRFTFLYPASSKFVERLATILKEELSKVGIEMDIQKMEWAAFLDKIQKKDFDATSLAWSTPFEGDPYQVWHSSQADIDGSSNFISFKNEKADELIVRAREEFDPEKRNHYLHEFHKILHEEQPYTFLFSSYSLVALSKKVENVKVHKAGLQIREWKMREETRD